MGTGQDDIYSYKKIFFFLKKTRLCITVSKTVNLFITQAVNGDMHLSGNPMLLCRL